MPVRAIEDLEDIITTAARLQYELSIEDLESHYFGKSTSKSIHTIADKQVLKAKRYIAVLIRKKDFLTEK